MAAQTWEQYMIRLRAFRDSLPAFVEGLALKLPATALSDVQGRIQETGIDADGNPLKPYSEGYLAYKKSRGRYTGKTDLTLTSRMWNNTGVVATETSDDGFLVSIAGRSNEAQGKLDGNSNRYGDVLAMSKEEQDELGLDLDGLLQRQVDKFLEGTLS